MKGEQEDSKRDGATALLIITFLAFLFGAHGSIGSAISDFARRAAKTSTPSSLSSNPSSIQRGVRVGENNFCYQIHTKTLNKLLASGARVISQAPYERPLSWGMCYATIYVLEGPRELLESIGS